MIKKNNTWILLLLLLMFMHDLTGTAWGREEKITVYSPLGQPPAIERVPMAPRVKDLRGKRIYIVDIGFSGTHQLLTELQDLLKNRYPDTEWILRDKIGTYFNDDPELWSEIKEKGDAMIMGVGH